MSPQTSADREVETCVRAFEEMGEDYVTAVPAVRSRLYPLLGGQYLLTARPRVIALRADGYLDVWSAWTGPLPKRRLYTMARPAARSSRQRRYVVLAQQPERLWVRKRWLATLGT